MSNGAFSRFYGLMAAMAALIAGNPGMRKAQAIEQLGGYQSRGHGLSKHSGKKPNHNVQTPWFTGGPFTAKVAHGGGAREVARRQRQIARGMLRPSA